MSWSEPLLKLARLGPCRGLALLEAAIGLGVAMIQVRWNGKRLSRLLQLPLSEREETETPAERPLELVAWAINAAGARLPFHTTCLMRALAARAMLARRGVRGRIRIGISEDSKEFRAHAWVVVGERPVVGWFRNETYNVLAQIN
jgi:hypothetical protein